MRFSILAAFFFLFTLVAAAPLDLDARAPKAPAGVKKPPCKRANGPIAEAIQHRGTKLGGGQEGDVFELTQPFNGHAAVVKVVNLKTNKFVRKDMVENEVRHLVAVHQYLGWAEKITNHDKGHVLYVVMKNMGQAHSKIKAQVPNAEADRLIVAANARYEQEFQMRNKDGNPENYVFRKVGGRWQAEIIDWLKGERTNGAGPLPALPPLESITDDDGCIVS